MDLNEAYRYGKDVLLYGAVVYTWWKNREKVTAARFAVLEKEVASRITAEALRVIELERSDSCKLHDARTKALEEDLIRIGSEVRGLPKHNDLAQIHGRINEINGALHEVSGGVKALGHQMNLVLEELIKR